MVSLEADSSTKGIVKQKIDTGNPCARAVSDADSGQREFHRLQERLASFGINKAESIDVNYFRASD